MECELPLRLQARGSSLLIIVNNNNVKDYHWICGNHGCSIKAKNMKEACKKAILAQIPPKLDKYDKEKLYFHKMLVAKGKLPQYW